jgi:hypothetical protein
MAISKRIWLLIVARTEDKAVAYNHPQVPHPIRSISDVLGL